MRLHQNKLKITAGLLLLAACVSVYLSPLRVWITVDNVAATIESIDALWYAPLLFIGTFAIACVLFLPASVFIVSAGLIWGGWPGALYAIVGAVLGAWASFHMSRFVGGNILSKLGKSGARLSGALKEAGFTALLILRLIPFFPFPIFNYGAGVSGVKSRDFVLSTALGILPATLVITFSAEALLAGLLTKEDAFIRLVVVCFSVLALVGIPLLFRKRAARALHLDPEDAPQESE